MNAEEHKTRHE